MPEEKLEQVQEEVKEEAEKDVKKSEPKKGPSDKTIIKNLRADLRKAVAEMDTLKAELELQENKNSILFQKFKSLQSEYEEYRENMTDATEIFYAGINNLLRSFDKITR